MRKLMHQKVGDFKWLTWMGPVRKRHPTSNLGTIWCGGLVFTEYDVSMATNFSQSIFTKIGIFSFLMKKIHLSYSNFYVLVHLRVAFNRNQSYCSGQSWQRYMQVNNTGNQSEFGSNIRVTGTKRWKMHPNKSREWVVLLFNWLRN